MHMVVEQLVLIDQIACFVLFLAVEQIVVLVHSAHLAAPSMKEVIVDR